MANKKKVNPKNKAAIAALKEQEEIENSKKEIENREKKIKAKKVKHKMTYVEKQRLTLKIAGWIMAIVMFLGSVIALFSYFITA